MSKKLNKYIAVLNYTDKTLLVSSGVGSGACYCQFATVADAPIGIVIAGISLVFLADNGILKTFEHSGAKLFCWLGVNSTA